MTICRFLRNQFILFVSVREHPQSVVNACNTRARMTDYHYYILVLYLYELRAAVYRIKLDERTFLAWAADTALRTIPLQ